MKEIISIKRWKANTDKEYLFSLPIYCMFLLVIPKRVDVRLKKIQRDLL